MQEFLSPTDEEEGSVTNQVELKISAPNHKIISVVVHRNWTTQQVYRTVIDKVRTEDDAVMLKADRRFGLNLLSDLL